MQLHFRNLRDYSKEFGFPASLSLIVQRKLGRKLIKLRPKGIAHTLLCRNGTSDFAVLRQALGKKECAFSLPEPPRCIIDAGANVGYASILFANLWKDAEILAIEPEKENFEMLLRNTAQYPSIRCIRGAVWSETRKLSLLNPNSQPFEFQFGKASGGEESAQVDAWSIKDLCSRYSIEQLDLLKLDIEGAELEVFRNSASDWHDNIRSIAVELHEWLAPGCEELVLGKMKGRRVEVQGEYTIFHKL